MTSPHGSEPDDRPAADPPDAAELERMLAELEQRVNELGAELARRRDERRSAGDRAAQHAEVDQLTEHLANAQVSWEKVREFFRSAIAEQRAGAPWGQRVDGDDLRRAGRPDGGR